MDRFTVALAFALIAVVLALLMLATKIGDKPEYIIEATNVAAPVCPKPNPCRVVDCDRQDTRRLT